MLHEAVSTGNGVQTTCPRLNIFCYECDKTSYKLNQNEGDTDEAKKDQY